MLDGIAMKVKKENQSLQTYIYIASGNDDKVAEFDWPSAAKVVCVVADETVAKAVSRNATGKSNLKIINAAVGTTKADGELRCWNFSKLNGLSDPSPILHEMFPGLRLRERKAVTIVTPKELVTEIGGLVRPAHLIIETPGIEMQILLAWKEDGLLDQIDAIEMRAANEVLFIDSAPSAALVEWLKAEGFVIRSEETDDPAWNMLYCQADLTERALTSANIRIAELTNALSDHKEALDDAKSALEARSKTLAEREAALKAAQEQVAGLDKALGDAKSALEAKSKSIISLRDQNAQLKDDIQRSFINQQKLAQDLGFALRLQDRLDCDLRDLQSKYAKVVTVKQQQDDLLSQLTPRLQRAALELQVLSIETPLTSQIRKSAGAQDSVIAKPAKTGKAQRQGRRAK